MATFWTVQNAGEKYAPLRLIIKNQTNKTLYYNFRGVTDAAGDQFQPWGTQVGLLSIYQKFRAHATDDSTKFNATTAMITANPLFGLLKLAFYTIIYSINQAEISQNADAMDAAAFVTNYRAGLVKPQSNLIVEMGMIQADGKLNNKAWPVTQDGINFSNCFIGVLNSNDINEGDEATLEKAARRIGIGIKFSGEKRNFLAVFTKRLFSTFVNIAGLPDGIKPVINEDSEKVNDATIDDFNFKVHGGTVVPESRSDFINLIVSNK